MVKTLEGRLEEFLKEMEYVREEKNNVMREQEDLLVLLSDQDAKCKEYKVMPLLVIMYSKCLQSINCACILNTSGFSRPYCYTYLRFSNHSSITSTVNNVLFCNG